MKPARQIYGFTLLEMLTALAIVALLIGLLIPALSMVQKAAQGVRQKAQFNTIEMALEAFHGDTGDYPPSNYTRLGNNSPGGYGADGYCGAQKLAEALIGMDGFGYHPKSQWRSDGTADFNNDGDYELIYDTTSGVIDSGSGTPLQTGNENLKARQGPYLELENSNAYKLSSMYTGYPGPTSGTMSGVLADTYVLCDMYSRQNPISNKKIGMPILYFRADTNNIFFKPSTLGSHPFVGITSQDAIYNVNENSPFYTTSPHWGVALQPIKERNVFYNRIVNPSFPGTLAKSYQDARPYRSQSFILLSAGADGVYGSTDDVYNFTEGEK